MDVAPRHTAVPGRRVAPGPVPSAPRPAPPRPAAEPAADRRRVDAVDLLRGLVMVLMLLDHSRDFTHADMLAYDPTDLSRASPALFLTRWITHFCAPVFVFLAGTGAYFQLLRGKPRVELSAFLVSRGLWLVVLELTVVRTFTWFNTDYASFLGLLQVIWTIGVSMVVLAGLVWLPVRAVGALGVAMIVLHNLLDGFQVASWNGPGTPIAGFWGSVWMILHQPGVIFPLGASGPPAIVMYPLVPWIGVMAAGYAFGSVYRLEPARRQRVLVRLGVGLLAGFVVLRATNLYGDPAPWSVRQDAVYTVLSFLNVTKYPASLLYLAMTLGPALLALAWFERTAPRRGPVGRGLITLGQVPLFFYLAQWFTAHALGLLLGLAAGQSVAWQFATPFERPTPNPGGLGFPLGAAYVLWAAGMLVLYPACRWFAAVKQKRNDWWLSYL